MTAKYETISSDSVTDFLARRPFSVIHLDAEWDGYRFDIQAQIESIMDSHGDVSFGYMDVDKNIPFATAIGLLNTPSCAYYRASELIAVVIGMKQNIAHNISLVRSDKVPDRSNVISRF